MRAFRIQFQPDLAPDLDATEVTRLIDALALSDSAENYQKSQGNDEGPYYNFDFRVTDAPQFWQATQNIIYTEHPQTMNLRKSTMVVCEGSSGWDNYLLLWHFDPTIEVDRLNEL